MNILKAILGITLILIFISCDNTNETNNDIDVPDEVKEAFNNAHPDAEDVEWEMEGDYFEVEFEENELNMEIEYDAEGNVMETEVMIARNELPESIQTYINDNYEDYDFEESEKIENADGIFFEVELESKKDGEVELLFDEEGNFLGDEDGDDDDEEEDD